MDPRGTPTARIPTRPENPLQERIPIAKEDRRSRELHEAHRLVQEERSLELQLMANRNAQTAFRAKGGPEARLLDSLKEYLEGKSQRLPSPRLREPSKQLLGAPSRSSPSADPEAATKKRKLENSQASQLEQVFGPEPEEKKKPSKSAIRRAKEKAKLAKKAEAQSTSNKAESEVEKQTATQTSFQGGSPRKKLEE